MNEILQLIGREKKLFEEDINKYESKLKEVIENLSFLVIVGGV